MPQDEIRAALSVHDSISPAQFHEMWSGSRERSAEFRLALAVLEQALDDLDRHRSARDAACRRIYHDARSWLLTIDRVWPYSFVNVCDLLDLSYDRIRTYVARRVRNHGEESSQASGEATPLACDA